jgi:tRNA A-37 threonylcarbamoyl transferase component Bud32
VSDRDRAIDELFDRVLDAPPEDREALLAARPEIRRDVESLVAAHDAMTGEFLAVPAGDRLRAAVFEPGDRIGRYTVRRLVAQGGSGTVYEAQQDRPHRTVALKVMHTGLDSDRAQERFQEEAEILARIEHPDIAHVYEAGVHEGVPYIAIEYVEGARSVTEHAVSLGRRDRLELFAEICDAVHHGHQQGIIHRDLKPANVLVKGERPKIVDFGIARIEGSDAGEISGTLAYMSPEQCEAGSHLDVRSDVYSLGVLLHELLRGELPYDLSTTSITDAVRVIREVPPEALGIDADLDAVAARAMAKERTARYPSASALASDVRRYLRREPVAARRAGRLHHAALFARRQPWLTAALGALLLVLVAGVLVSVRFALRAERRRVEAEHETYRATIVAADAALRVFDVEGAQTQLELSPRHLRGWEWRYLVSRCDLSERTFRWGDGAIYHGCVAARRARAAATSGRGAAVWDVETGEILRAVPRDQLLQTASALSPDGECWIVGDEVGRLVVRSVDSGEVLGQAREEAGVWSLVSSPDGSRFAVGTRDGVLSLRSVDGTLVARFEGHEGVVMSIAFSPDGRRLISGGSDGTIRFWNVDTGEESVRLDAHADNVESLAVSPDGALLVSGSFDGTIRLWDAREGTPRQTLRQHMKGVKVVAFSPRTARRSPAARWTTPCGCGTGTGRSEAS